VTEIVAESDRPGTYTKINAAFAGGATVNAIVFYLLKDWQLVLLCYYGLFFLTTAFLLYYYVESPPIEIISKSKDAQESYAAFMRIAEMNGVTDHGITLTEI
jgi:hypothetical protein